MNKNHNSIDGVALVGGIALLVAGLYWFLSSVRVTPGFGSLHFGGLTFGSGLVVVPFVIGVVMLFYNFKSIPARCLTVVGLLLILASVIGNTRFVMRSVSLFTYLLMLVLALGGAALIVKAVWGGGKRKK